jgi:cell division septation protein DedD
MRFLLTATVVLCVPALVAQEPIGRTSAAEVQVSGAVDISHGETTLGNGSAITAGNQAVKITLQRGGELRLCSTSSVHLSKDRSISDPANSALMMALDRGAIEANYTVGKYSDVMLTPDLRILISGPGKANLSIRVNGKGDTCVDNHGADAPYVIVSSQLEGGAYRVLPDQRVNFEHGSLQEVVDHEPEACGCPIMPVTSVASAGGGPSSTAADTAFPIAESEGLAPPPAPATVPTVPPGETHAEVTVPLTYNGEKPAAAPPAASTPPAAASTPAPPAADSTPAVPAAAAVVPAPEPTPPPQTASAPQAQQGGFFHRIGHFFSRIFG